MMLILHKKSALILLILMLGLGTGTSETTARTKETPPCSAEAATSKCPQAQKKSAKKLDRSGKPRTGKASYYGREFYGKKMANGKPMNPKSNIAASRTLPLGTKAEVKNLETGKSAVVAIEDRGPYVEGRIVDLTPKTAEELGIKEKGVAPVEVRPLSIPPEKDSAESATKR